MSAMENILIIQTGGTIDKDYPRSIRGYAFEIGDAAVLRVLGRIGLDHPVTTVCRKDSQEITAGDRLQIHDVCASTPSSRILITHGSDTILETADYLSQFSDLARKFIVLTGAMKPETMKNSDADFNVGCAWGALQTLSVPGIYISMHGLLAKWDEVKRDSKTNRFVRK